MDSNRILTSIKNIKHQYLHNQLSNTAVLYKLNNLDSSSGSLTKRIHEYLYKNGILNKSEALHLAKAEVNKFKDSPLTSYLASRKEQYNNILHSDKSWFETYQIRNGNHDAILSKIDNWKLLGLLNNLICDLYIGSLA